MSTGRRCPCPGQMIPGPHGRSEPSTRFSQSSNPLGLASFGKGSGGGAREPECAGAGEGGRRGQGCAGPRSLGARELSGKGARGRGASELGSRGAGGAGPGSLRAWEQAGWGAMPPWSLGTRELRGREAPERESGGDFARIPADAARPQTRSPSVPQCSCCHSPRHGRSPAPTLPCSL